MTGIDLEGCLRDLAQARGDSGADALVVQLGDALADGFRRDLDMALDMETAGFALAIGGISLVAVMQEHGGVSRTDLAEALALAGENLVRTARARATEAPGSRHQEFVLTYHPLNGTQPVEIPLRTHWVFPVESCGEFVVSTRELPPSAGEPVSDDDVPCPHPACVCQSASDQEAFVVTLHKADRLGYLAPSDEWMNGGEPLPEPLQHVADKLAKQGRIPDLRAPHVRGGGHD